MTVIEYSKALAERARIVSLNRSQRMRGLPCFPLPPKPEKPMGRFAYDADGVYVGKLADNQECPQGCTVKLEPLLC